MTCCTSRGGVGTVVRRPIFDKCVNVSSWNAGSRVGSLESPDGTNITIPCRGACEQHSMGVAQVALAH